MWGFGMEGAAFAAFAPQDWNFSTSKQFQMMANELFSPLAFMCILLHDANMIFLLSTPRVLPLDEKKRRPAPRFCVNEQCATISTANMKLHVTHCQISFVNCFVDLQTGVVNCQFCHKKTKNLQKLPLNLTSRWSTKLPHVATYTFYLECILLNTGGRIKWRIFASNLKMPLASPPFDWNITPTTHPSPQPTTYF